MIFIKTQACYSGNNVTLCAGARHSFLGDYSWIPVGHFRVPPGLCIKTRLSAQPFLWKWVLFVWEWKIISLACSISKVEHLTSFWYRGPGELGNGFDLIDRLETRSRSIQYSKSRRSAFFSWLRRSCRVGMRPTKPLVWTTKQSVSLRIQVRASSQTKGLERGWKNRTVRLARFARKTFTPRFTDLITDFEKKNPTVLQSTPGRKRETTSGTQGSVVGARKWMGARKNGRARGRHARREGEPACLPRMRLFFLAPIYFLAPATQATNYLANRLCKQ